MTTTRPGTRAAAALAASAVLLGGCASPGGGVRAGGRGDEAADVVAAPALLSLAPNPDAGFSPDASRTPPAPPGAVEAVRVADAVPLGTHVRAGEPVAHLEAAAQEAAVALARADADLAHRRVELLTSQGVEVRDRSDELHAKRRDVATAIATLTDKRSQLLRTRADLRAKQAELDRTLPTLLAQRAEVATAVDTLTAQRQQAAAAIAGLEQQRATLAQAPDSPEKQAALPQLDAALADARAGLAQIEAALAQAGQGLAQLDDGLDQARNGARQLASGLGELAKGLGTLESNLAKARQGRRTIDDALTQLADAEGRLADAEQLARVTADSSGIAVARAEQQRSLATLVAPRDGTVVATSLPGAVLAPGAPVVTLRPDAAPTVTAWLAPDAAARLCPGDAGSVRTDWGATYEARVARVGVRADYPPTRQATDDVHLTRAVAVTLDVVVPAARGLDKPNPPPAGVPVDLSIVPCKEN